MKINQKYAAILAGVATITSLALAIPAFAQTNAGDNGQGQSQGASQGNHYGQWMGRGNASGAPGMTRGTPPAAVGSVTSVNGTTLTVTSRAFVRSASNGTAPATPPASPAVTTYTVNASNATVMKNNATSTVSAIAVGDMVVIQGTVSGTNITATSIRDGMMMRPGGMKPGTPGGASGSGTANMPSPIQGNGQPVVAGTVSAINGGSLTVTNKSNVTYTVDATNAKVVQGNSTASLSSVAIGDSVIIQGTTNGTAITASTVIDQKVPAASTNGSTADHKQNLGFFGSIGQFFKNLFGF